MPPPPALAGAQVARPGGQSTSEESTHLLLITRWSGARQAPSQPSAMADSAHTGLGSPPAPKPLVRGPGGQVSLPSRMTVMGLGRKPSPPGHKVLYSAVEKVS